MHKKIEHDLPADRLMEHFPLYGEHFDEIDPVMSRGTHNGRCGNDRQAIIRQLATNGLTRPLYNKNIIKIT